MTLGERQLARIGFGRDRDEPVCWRASRIGPPAFPARAAASPRDPAGNPDVLRWRAVLRRDPPGPYRISRA